MALMVCKRRRLIPLASTITRRDTEGKGGRADVSMSEDIWTNPAVSDEDRAAACKLRWLVDGRIRFEGADQREFDKEGYVLLPRLLSRRGLQYLRQRVDLIHQGKCSGGACS